MYFIEIFTLHDIYDHIVADTCPIFLCKGGQENDGKHVTSQQ